MADTGYKYAGTVSQEAGAYSSWTNLSNIVGAPDSNYATIAEGTATASANLYQVGLIIGDVKQGATGLQDVSLPINTVGDVVLGSGSSLFGCSLSPSIVSGSGFGAYIFGNDASSPWITLVTNYSFSIPDGATINGVEIVPRGYYTRARININIYLTSVGIKVYYTEGAGAEPKKILLVSNDDKSNGKKALLRA